VFDQLITTILIAAGLTRDELTNLADMLCRNGHALARQGQTIGRLALQLHDDGTIASGSDTWNQMWAIRDRYVGGMDEMFDLMAETQTAIRTLREADMSARQVDLRDAYAILSA
jgi:FAD/FMN-containing dehydrogenase